LQHVDGFLLCQSHVVPLCRGFLILAHGLCKL
jgi:hypothetical protein